MIFGEVSLLDSNSICLMEKKCNYSNFTLILMLIQTPDFPFLQYVRCSIRENISRPQSFGLCRGVFVQALPIYTGSSII